MAKELISKKGEVNDVFCHVIIAACRMYVHNFMLAYSV